MNIKCETVYDANCYMISDAAGAFLIDIYAVTDTIREFIEENREKEFLILATHRHFDHVAGIYEAKKLSGAPVAIHSADACGIESTVHSLADRAGVSQTPFKPDKLLHDGDVLRVGDTSIRVFHTPGHTAGSVCYIVENVIFSGDTLFRQSVGRTDFPTGSDEQLQHSLRRLFSLKQDYTVYPGHGEPTALYYEKNYNPFFDRSVL